MYEILLNERKVIKIELMPCYQPSIINVVNGYVNLETPTQRKNKVVVSDL